ncbi:MAG: hypothetical protein LQ351_003147 [Letrouitia transgressa]|nr:MAG: hypothetical protein LQ351_003147 [Letrouitia transgressa]
MITPPLSPTAMSPVGSQRNVSFAEPTFPVDNQHFSASHNVSRTTTYVGSSMTTRTEDDYDGDFDFSVEPSLATVDEDSPWSRKMILSLDGGGVRGYSSLLILKRLMHEVANLEMEANPEATTSAFSPLIDSKSLHTDPMMKDMSKETSEEGVYRPCHYFDYIAGSSTGGLIAIMLGRLRMTVEAALEQYKGLSEKVFEKPSSRLKRSLSKYSSTTRRDTLEQLFTTLRPAQPSPHEEIGKFKSDAVRCRTIVCSNRSDLEKSVSRPFLFRSYEHSAQTHSRPDVFERNPFDTTEFDIWQVARATSAAPSYFKSTKLFQYRYFDAAVNMNNPSWEVLNEVNTHNKLEGSIDLLLSIGAGNAYGNTTKSKSAGALQKVLNDISDISDVVHEKINVASKSQAFAYYRWDVRDGLEEVRLDEWKPKGNGEITLRRIEHATSEYLKNESVQKQIRSCALDLVRARSLRAKTMRWESFATGTRYRCPIRDCKNQHQRFQNRNELMDHLQTEHGKAPPDAENFLEIQTLLDQGRTNSE